MSSIIDYPTVVETLTRAGAVCNYHNSGSFGLRGDDVRTVGWLTRDDPTIRTEMRPFTRLMTLDELLSRFEATWTKSLPGPIWILPASHWAFELTYGNAEWLPERLRSIGIDPLLLKNRNDGSAIAIEDSTSMRLLVKDLLTRSTGSDFTAAWPGHATVAMLHHHGQMWWRTREAIELE